MGPRGSSGLGSRRAFNHHLEQPLFTAVGVFKWDRGYEKVPLFQNSNS